MKTLAILLISLLLTLAAESASNYCNYSGTNLRVNLR